MFKGSNVVFSRLDFVIITTPLLCTFIPCMCHKAEGMSVGKVYIPNGKVVCIKRVVHGLHSSVASYI
jgi:hypothetical protein